MSDQICIDWLEAPFCSGPSDPPVSIPRPVDDYLEWWTEEEFVDFEELPFDCAAGPDEGSQEYIDAGWEQVLIDQGCFDHLPNDQQILYPLEIDEPVEEVGTIAEVAVIEPLPTLPETGVDLLSSFLIGIALASTGIGCLVYGKPNR